MLEPSGAQHAPLGSSLLPRVLDERLCGTSGTGQYAAHSLLLRFARWRAGMVLQAKAVHRLAAGAD